MRHSSTRSILAVPRLAVGRAAALVGCSHAAAAPGCGQLTVNDAWVTPAHAGGNDEYAADREQVITDGRDGGAAGAIDDSKAAK